MRIRLLGPLEVYDGTVWRGIGAARWRSLLATLLVHDGQVVSVDRITEELWADAPPKTATNQVHGYIARVRQLLGDRAGKVLVTRTPGYQLRLRPEDTDLGRFTTLVADGRAAARAGDPARAAALLNEALSLWRGQAYADVPTTPLVAAEVVRLDEQRLDTLEARIDADLACGRHDNLISELRTLTREHPLRERLWDQLIVALSHTGRQAEAVTAYHDLRAVLRQELGIEPSPALQRRYSELLRAAPPRSPALGPSSPTPQSRSRLWRGARCQVSRLYGRDRDRHAVATLLSKHRLVTVTGTGGCGKSTMALRVADDVTQPTATPPPRHTRVLVLSLASLTDGDQILSTLGDLLEVGNPLRVALWDGVVAALDDRPTLLVVDNCEHLAEECATLAEQLLAACPELSILATSRQPLGIAEEAVWPLEPLATPPAGDAVDPHTPAVALFLDRARAAAPTLVVSDAEMTDVGAICRRLDGLPLAIELAAARVRAFTIRQIAERLATGFELVTHGTTRNGTRHSTLAATIDWSYRLLNATEQRLLDRLSIFTGVFDLAMAEAVCGAPPLSPAVVASTLASLVDRSLVQPTDTEHGRQFRLLQATRAVAADRLATTDDHLMVADRHLRYWLQRARRLDALPGYRARVREAKTIAPYLADVRAALVHAYASDRAADAAELTACLFEVWLTHPAYLPEGEQWLERALRIEGPQAPQPAVVTLLRFYQAVLLAFQGNLRANLAAVTNLRDDLAQYRPREFVEAQAILLTTRRALLDASVLADVPGVVAAVSTPEHLTHRASNVRTVLTAAGWVLATWGRYDEAAELSARYDRIPAADRGAPSFAQQGLRIETAVRRGQLAVVPALVDDILTRLASAPDPGEHDTARRVVAIGYLATDQPDRARDFLAAAIRWLRTTYRRIPLTLHYHHALYAEALRRCGDPQQAVTALIDGLHAPRGQTHLLFALPCVVEAAVLAAVLGDTRVSRQLAHGWDTVRRRVGLPAPTGVEDATATILQLDPDAPRQWDPHANAETIVDQVHELIAAAHRWCRSVSS